LEIVRLSVKRRFILNPFYKVGQRIRSDLPYRVRPSVNFVKRSSPVWPLSQNSNHQLNFFPLYSGSFSPGLNATTAMPISSTATKAMAHRFLTRPAYQTRNHHPNMKSNSSLQRFLASTIQPFPSPPFVYSQNPNIKVAIRFP
jgi:hypothetical protein